MEDELSEEDLVEEIDSELLVRETFKNLFPESFDGVLPVRKHKVHLRYPLKKLDRAACMSWKCRRISNSCRMRSMAWNCGSPTGATVNVR